ncbi:hypothetical protein F3Y22_tig00111008pilonHSYRG00389 [Hibiscus syriacus]|uniref:NAC domain-containing protein n=1 Tax=Hibiscus syriacus TaxID=106335 RepID=A0A6A2Z8Y8_HIBSY|nr:hypothetical protein F3Y22_tig00111008pilonHSYRG00389 [Hibiscus syriacus]
MGSSNCGVPPVPIPSHRRELLHYYLTKKVSFQKFDMEVIREVDLNKMEPWELQGLDQSTKRVVLFQPQGNTDRVEDDRATHAGFWKATGRDKCIRNSYKKIGMRKTLVFSEESSPWPEDRLDHHEYRLEDGDDPQGNPHEDGWVVCRVFKKKNLFKVVNNGGSSINSSNRQLNNTTLQATAKLHHFPHAQIKQPIQPQHHHHRSTKLGGAKQGGASPSLSSPAPTTHASILSFPNPNSSQLYRWEWKCEVYQAGLEGVGGGRDDENEGMNEWGMLVTSHIGMAQDSSKGLRLRTAPLPTVVPRCTQSTSFHFEER